MKNKRLLIIVITIVLLLLVPFIAMQFTDEVNWTFFDFVIAAALLLGTGLMCELVMRTIRKTNYRIAICGAFVAILVVIWLELAVGILGTPFAGQ